MQTQIHTPSIADIRKGASAVLTFADGMFEIRQARKSDIHNDRTAHVVRNQQPVLVRKDGAKARGTQHQISATGASESCLAFMPDFALFKATGSFMPASVDDERIVTDKRWRSSVLLFKALERELCRRAYASPDQSFSTAILMRKPSPQFKADLEAAAEAGGNGSIAASRPRVLDDVMQHLLADAAFCGAVVVPVDSSPRGFSTLYKLNAAWLDTLKEAGRMNGALGEPQTATETQETPPAMAA